MTDMTAPDNDMDDTAFGVDYVYCMSHLRAHSTGWCGVPNRDKIPLKAETLDEANVEVKDHGWPVFDGSRTSYEPRPRWNVRGQLVDPSGAVLDERARHLS